MADSSYNLEVQNILSFLKMQHLNPDPQIITEQVTTDINPECLVSPRYLKKYKNKQVLYLESFCWFQQRALFEGHFKQALPSVRICHSVPLKYSDHTWCTTSEEFLLQMVFDYSYNSRCLKNVCVWDQLCHPIPLPGWVNSPPPPHVQSLSSVRRLPNNQGAQFPNQPLAPQLAL